jgi:hypothetical protein
MRVMMVMSALVATAPAMATPPAADYARAYAMAARCMVFNGYIKDQATARVVFDAWKRLGELQGLKNAQMNADMERAIAHENVRLHQHADYRAQTQVDCRALGWAR